MPVSPRGYDAWIEVEGSRLSEYKTEHDAVKNQTTCWIPCEAGKEFRIGFTVPDDRGREANHTVDATLDGKSMTLRANIYYQVKTYGGRGAATRYFAEHLVKNDTASRAFQFGNLELTDDERVLEAKTAEFGKIEVRVRTVESYAPVERPSAGKPVDEDYRVHERAKKGMAHCVKLGAEKPTAKISRVLRAINPKHADTFVFNYRHMDMLVANDIAPSRLSSSRKPSARAVSQSASSLSTCSRLNATPGPSHISQGKRKAGAMIKEEDGDDGRSDTADTEVEDLEARLVALKAKKASKRVKQESGTSTLVHGEVIDLTAMEVDDGQAVGKVKKEPQGQGSLVSGMVIDLTI